MRKVLNLLELIFILLGGVLCVMTPFWTVWAIQSKEEIKTIGESILLAVIVMLLWPLQVVGLVVATLALLLEVLWKCIIRRQKLETLLLNTLKTFVNTAIGPYWDNYQARKNEE